MRKLKKLLLGGGWFLAMALLFSLNVCASSWIVGGEADLENNVCILTEKYNTKQVGRITRKVPIDARKSFTLSFDYWMGDYSNDPREGFQVVFTDESIDPDGCGDYADLGYDHILEPVGLFRSVEFDSYESGGKGHIALMKWQKGDGYSPVHMNESSSMRLSDSAWHTVRLEYLYGKMTVYVDGQWILSSSDFSLKGITYVAFTGSNSYYGTQTTKIRNISIQSSEDPALITYDANGGSVSPKQQYILRYGNQSLPTPTKYGNTFLGWYTSRTGGKMVINSRYNFAANQTLYAHWKDNTVKVIFNANKGTVSTKTKSVLPKSKIGTLPTPTRKNYTFTGWYTKKSGGKKNQFFLCS